MTKWRGRILKSIGFLVILLLTVFLACLHQTRIGMTRSGIYQELMVPALGVGTLSVPLYAADGKQVRIAGFLDGPVVRKVGRDQWQVSWFCEQTAFTQKSHEPRITISCAGREHSFNFADVALLASPNDWNRPTIPDRIAVLSDLEGNAAFLEASLRDAGIVDQSGRWSFAEGHLVILGDAVDRGRDVFRVLWRLHDLDRQARKVGGAVHLVHGNHEQYVLRGNYSRTNIEHVYALNRLGGPTAAFGPDTVIGRWMRQQPVSLKLGNVLFVHGGVNVGLLSDEANIDAINKASLDYWSDPALAGQRSPLRDLVFGNAGLTQYRGYLMPVEGMYPLGSQTDVDRALAHFGVRTIVVAHTIVDEVKPLFNGNVYAVDLNDNNARQQMLFFEAGKPIIRDISAKRDIPDGGSEKSRGFNLFSAEDWSILLSVAGSSRYFSSLPYPY